MSLFDFAAEYAMLPRDGLVLCVVSGGADSMYLLARLLEGRAEGGYRVAAAHSDHRLRGEESRRDADFVRDWCAGHDVPFVLGGGDVAAQAAGSGRGVEETARAMRYAFLEETADRLGAEVIATAHTADDNAETVLMNLIRGSGLEGLCGIPPRRGRVVRPLLTTTREEVVDWLTGHGVPHVEDGSNADERYTRNYLRRQVMPLLRRVNPRAAEHMAQAAARLRRDNDVLNAQAMRAAGAARKAEEGWVIAVSALELLPDPVALRAVRQLIARAGGENVTSAHLRAALGVIRGSDPSAMVHLPRVLVCRVYGDVLFTPRKPERDPLPEEPVARAGVTVWGEWTIRCEPGVCPEQAAPMAGEFWLAEGRLDGPLTVRPRREGDSLRPAGRPDKPVKKWMIDEKVPRLDRSTVPVLWDGRQVAAVGGLGPREELLAVAGETALHLILEHEGEDEYEP